MKFVNIINYSQSGARKLSRFTQTDNAYRAFADRFDALMQEEHFTLVFDDKSLLFDEIRPKCIWRIEKTVHGFVLQLKTTRHSPYYGFLAVFEGWWITKNGNGQNLLHWRNEDGDSVLPERFFLTQEQAARLIAQFCENHRLEFHPDHWENTYCIFCPPYHPLPEADTKAPIKETGYFISTHGLPEHREDKPFETLNEALNLLLNIFKDQGNKHTFFSVSLKDQANLVRYTVEQSGNKFLLLMDIGKNRNGFFEDEAPWFFKNGYNNKPYHWHGSGGDTLITGRFFHQWRIIKQLLDKLLKDSTLLYDPDHWENAWCCTISGEEPMQSIADQLYDEKAMAIMEKASGKTINRIDWECYDDPDVSDTDYWITTYIDYILNEMTSDKHKAYEVGLQHDAMRYRYVVEKSSDTAYTIMEKCFDAIQDRNSDFFRIRVKDMAQEIAWKIEKLKGQYLVILFVDRHEDLFPGLDNGYWIYKSLEKPKTAEISIDSTPVPLKYLHTHTEILPLVRQITQGKALPLDYDCWDYMDEKPPFNPYDKLI